jgi:hypothetical protein
VGEINRKKRLTCQEMRDIRVNPLPDWKQSVEEAQAKQRK